MEKLGKSVSVAALPVADRALLHLGENLKRRGYRFTTISPASHGQVYSRPLGHLPRLEDVFGWNRAFRPVDLPEQVLQYLTESGEIKAQGPLLQSQVRFSTLGEQLFVHSAFPTEAAEAVFFGPDTYRFARFVRQSLVALPALPGARIVDIGCGTGAGGLHTANLVGGQRYSVLLTDINLCALRFARINALLNGFSSTIQLLRSDLFDEVDGLFDLIISNPPYLFDPLARVYRHGGGKLGSDLSLNIVKQGLEHLAPRGRLLLYTGSAVIAGRDALHDTLKEALSSRRLLFDYEEIDPDVFGTELEQPPYHVADRIAVVGVTIQLP